MKPVRRYNSHEAKAEITPDPHAAAGDHHVSIRCRNADYFVFPRLHQYDHVAGDQPDQPCPEPSNGYDPADGAGADGTGKPAQRERASGKGTDNSKADPEQRTAAYFPAFPGSERNQPVRFHGSGKGRRRRFLRFLLYRRGSSVPGDRRCKRQGYPRTLLLPFSLFFSLSLLLSLFLSCLFPCLFSVFFSVFFQLSDRSINQKGRPPSTVSQPSPKKLSAVLYSLP